MIKKLDPIEIEDKLNKSLNEAAKDVLEGKTLLKEAYGHTEVILTSNNAKRIKAFI